MAELINDSSVYGWLERPSRAANPTAVLAITHGAGSNCNAPLIVAVAEAFAAQGFLVLRYDLPFRRARPQGPPLGTGPGDREGIRQAAQFVRTLAPGAYVYLAGHSYGGRQTSIATAEDPRSAAGLLLLSYPLHPPKQPEKLRTEHFPSLRVPALFVHGIRDEFGTIEEVESARQRIPARTELQQVENAPHGLSPKYATQIAEWFVTFTKG